MTDRKMMIFVELSWTELFSK